jgi:uncharacterized protein (TIGR02117 family)
VRRLGRLLLAIVLAPVLLSLAFALASVGGALWPAPGAVLPGKADGPPQRVGLIAGPIHYDLLLPLTPGVRDRFAFAAAAGVPLAAEGAEWLVAGWGSEAVYTTTGRYTDLTPGAFWRAATGDRAVLRLDAGRALAETSGILWLALSPAALDALAASVAADVASPQALAAAGFTATDAYFPARGGFHGFRTCNVWVGEKLRAAGLRLGRWTPTTFALRLSLWRFAGAQTLPP